MWKRKGNPGEDQKATRRMVRTSCPAHNCGGRCLLLAHIENGRVVSLDTDDRRDDSVEAPRLVACARGRAYLQRQYHPDRLLYPLKRVGPRGEGRFRRISWDEALDLMASELTRIRGQYGNEALFVPYGTGSYSQLNGSWTARRLLNCIGGSLGITNSYSWGAINVATPMVYGTLQTGNQRQDWLNSRYIIMWGWNPAEMRDGTNSDYFIKLAREKGIRVVCVDPRMSLSAAALADEWVPIRPGTDTALMSAMAHVIISEGLHDIDFIHSHCQGFDRETMPDEAREAESYEDYIMGRRDGIPKTPEWAEAITTVPRETIARIAREYATARPAVLYQGYGMQRRAYGEQVVRAGCTLAAITGNIGIPGGWASGLAKQAGDGGGMWNTFPVGNNPVKATIPVFLWTEAILRGPELTAREGLEGTDRLSTSIRMIWSVASNILINQHANINRTAGILKDEKKVEFIVAQDHFMTPSARFADLVLPASMHFETWGVNDGWKYSDELLLLPKLVDPPGECRSDYDIGLELARKMGVEAEYSEGRDEKAWLDWLLGIYREKRFPDLPGLDELLASNVGVWTKPVTQAKVAFEDFRRDPLKHPLTTVSGKVELFSLPLHQRGEADAPALPKYLQEWESPFGEDAARYPLQAIGHHTYHRVHSTHDNNDWLEEAFPQRVFINPLDAARRGIVDGDRVKVFNQRGATILPARVTPRIIPGVVDIPQGAWWNPDKEGIDRRGSINVLTSERWTPISCATTQHTIMVQVEKAI